MDVDHDGKVSQFKDCKLWPGHAEKWDWSTTGTRHKPGIQPADVEAMLDSIDVLILSEGMQRALGWSWRLPFARHWVGHGACPLILRASYWFL